MSAVAATIRFLEDLANRLDQWAEQSKRGGWSTHQVAANAEAANDCRRQAAKLRSANLQSEPGYG